MKLLKNMNKEELLQELERVQKELKDNIIDNDTRFLLEVRCTNIERKLLRKYNYSRY